MASMDIEKIIQDLNRRFAIPLPEYYRRHIIFWYDEDKEFEDKLEDIQLDHADLVIHNKSNTFEVKRLLSDEGTNKNYLVYEPVSYDRPDDDWLLDIKLYSEEFRADLISIWMDEMGIVSSLDMRKWVKQYRKYFNAKSRRSKITEMDNKPQNPVQLHKAVLAAICGLKEADPSKIIETVFQGGMDKTENKVYQSIVEYSADQAFWAMIYQGTGYSEEEKDIGQLAIHMLLTAATRTMDEDQLKGLEPFYSVQHQAYCYDFISDWLRSSDSQQIYEIARYVEEEVRLVQRFNQMNIADLLDTECFPCINEIILKKQMSDVSNQLISLEQIRKIIEKRRMCVWYDYFKHFYEGLAQVANMQEFYKAHAAGFHLAQSRDLWKNYTEDFYKMDQYYRLFHLCFQKSLERTNLILDDSFKQVVTYVEGLYSHWFLTELGDQWSTICADDMKEYGRVLEITKQEDFYNTYVKGSENRIFVIISDAMRYEVAQSLSEDLTRETKCQVELNSMQSTFPSITKCGMAALLPHEELTGEIKNDSLVILADGMSTTSTNRDMVLKETNKNSVALKYNDLIAMKRAERISCVKGMQVVYIYHDVIDEASHHSDAGVFPACDKAITELKNMVRIIVNEFSGTNIVITSDHGFLYTYSPLKESDKVDKKDFEDNVIEYGRRYAIMEKGSKPEYLLPVKLFNGSTDFEGFAPRENIRIKMSGGGLNFVHGGISLQEMVVPVIQYHYLRNSSMEYKRNKEKYDTKPVQLTLLSSSRKISNMIFNLSFYQKEAVGENREATTYNVYFEDAEGQLISDVTRIIADKTTVQEKDRTFACKFNLKSGKYNRMKKYYLVIADEGGLQKPQQEEFQIDIAFAIDDFDFFS